ncbi:hypothetical protein ABZ656_09535 [Streptomyces sp. NPDC007095]|uniref:hypothetical protein n=1 Tax=Streptomyces sp. NPDC007095 TaxID=3154482 RepID=UPI00101B520C
MPGPVCPSDAVGAGPAALVACHERVVVKPYAHRCVSRSVADELRAGRGLDPVGIPTGRRAKGSRPPIPRPALSGAPASARTS